MKKLPKPQTAINLDTGEIYDEMTEEEMREFDGDIEEPQDIDDEPEDSFDTTAFDKTALCKLDLIREGEALHHCVGRMNYDQRMVREESLIFFIRNKQEPDTPFVTVEYSISQKRVLQCYGEHDHKPSSDVLHYVNKVWLSYANKTLKQIAA